MIPAACPSDDTLARLVEAALDAGEAAAVQTHIDGCARCQALYAAVARAIADAAHFEGGETIGKYRVEDRLGAGGMGVVYRALDLKLRRKVALKLLAPGLTDDPQARARLEREARACASLDHPHVGGVHEIGEHQGRVFLVMPLFEGGTLKERLQAGPLGQDEALAIFRQLTSALAAAHQAGVVHRDVKPGNIMLTPGGVRLVDFGLAKLSSLSATLSSAGQLLGTPAYMAPEQFEGESDARSDVWSAGAVAYEMLAGRAPFSADTLPSLAATVRLKDPAPLSAPRELEAVILKCLAKEPERRYPTALALEADLARLAQNQPTVARPVGAVDKLGRLGRRWRWPIAVGAVGLVAVAAVALGMRASSAERVRRAQAFTQKAAELRALMREAHLLPLHDTRPERAAVRAAMNDIARQLPELGREGAATGHYALGSGWAALGDWQPALGELEQAWAAGERDPEMTFLLGYAGSRLYHEQLEEARNLLPKARRAREEELQKQLRDPALARLREAAAPESRELVEALIAFDEGRFDKALAAAEHAFAAAPRRYEAGAIAAEAQASLGAEQWRKGDLKQAVAWLEAAGATYKKVTEIARSDDALYAEAARQRYQGLGLYAERGDVGEPMMRDLVALWQSAEKANGDDVQLQLGEAQAESAWGSLLAGKQADAELHLRNAVRIAERVLAARPEEARAWATLGTAWSSLADWVPSERTSGAEKAVQALQKAVALHPDATRRSLLSSAWVSVARDQLLRGLDSTASWEQARKELESVLAIDPANQMVHYNLGDVLLVEATARELAGGDPLPLWAAAAEHLQRAAELDRADAMPTKRLADLMATRALYRVRHGQDAAADLADGRANLLLTTRADDSRPELWRTRAILDCSEALAMAAQGKDPGPTFARARASADKLIAGWGGADAESVMLRAEIDLWTARTQRRRKGDPQAALRRAQADAESARRLAPKDAEPWELLARVQLVRAELGQPGAAAAGLEALDAAARVGPPLPEISALRVRLLERHGDLAAAAKLRAGLPPLLFAVND